MVLYCVCNAEFPVCTSNLLSGIKYRTQHSAGWQILLMFWERRVVHSGKTFTEMCDVFAATSDNLPNSDIALWWGGALAWTLGCVFSWEHVVHVAWGWGSTSPPPHTRPFDVKAVESLKHCRRPWLPCTNHPLLIKNAKKVWTRQHLMVAVLVFMRFTLAPMAPW